MTPTNSAIDALTRLRDAPFPMWIFDIQTLAFLEVNDAAIRMYGYSRQQFLAMTILDIRPIEDIPALLRREWKERQHSTNGEVWQHLKRDGTVIAVEITSFESEFNGRGVEIVIVREIH
jgi:PAS domain S-box-containing protein